jgi:hypothetical protein
MPATPTSTTTDGTTVPVTRDIFGNIINDVTGGIIAGVGGVLGSNPLTAPIVGAVQGVLSGTKTPCQACSPTDLSDCLTCASQGLTKGLITIGVDVGLFALLLFGIWLFFADDVVEGLKVAAHG